MKFMIPLVAGALSLLQAIPAQAWTTSFSEANNPEGDNALSVSVQSLTGRASITFVCSEGMMLGKLDNHSGERLDGPGAVYAGDLQIGSDGLHSTLEFGSQERTVDLARLFMRAQGNVDVRYSGRVTRGELRDTFPATGATKALAPLMAHPLCGLS